MSQRSSSPEAPQRPVGPDAPTDLDADPGRTEMGHTGAADRFYLVVRRAEVAEVVDLPLETEIVVGRGEEAGVRVDEARVSRRHARIVHASGGPVVEDLGSRNGTAVNGAVLRGAVRSLQSGDVIQIGSAEIVVASAARWERADAPPAQDVELDGMVVADAAMVSMVRTAQRLAKASSSVLLLGETGVGKEVVAERIHRWSARASGPMVRLSCASLPETLLESELFGHERGAFTGADRQKTGYIEAAHGGTLFLDETGELPLGTQVKLLRVLETKRLCRVGGTEEREVDVRVLCATHRDLEEDVARGRFREDLLYRINTFTLTIPPLRARPTEISLLAELFARELSPSVGARGAALAPRFDGPSMAALRSYRWPGNVRELKNAVEHAVVMAEGKTIRREHLPPSVRDGSSKAESAGGVGVKGELMGLERARIAEALAKHEGNQTHAARSLGISRRALIYKMQKYDLRSK